MPQQSSGVGIHPSFLVAATSSGLSGRCMRANGQPWGAAEAKDGRQPSQAASQQPHECSCHAGIKRAQSAALGGSSCIKANAGVAARAAPSLKRLGWLVHECAGLFSSHLCRLLPALLRCSVECFVLSFEWSAPYHSAAVGWVIESRVVPMRVVLVSCSLACVCCVCAWLSMSL